MNRNAMKKSILSTLIAVGCMLIMAFSAFAGTSMKNFQCDVPAYNGSVNTTYQVKSSQGRSGRIVYKGVGGGYVVDCRMRDVDDKTEGAWVNGCKTGTAKSLPSRASHQKGDRVCVRISNELFTPVAVHVYGTWRSDNP